MRLVSADDIRTGAAGPWKDTWCGTPEYDDPFKIAGAEPELDADGKVVLLCWDLSGPGRPHKRVPVEPGRQLAIVS